MGLHLTFHTEIPWEDVQLPSVVISDVTAGARSGRPSGGDAIWSETEFACEIFAANWGAADWTYKCFKGCKGQERSYNKRDGYQEYDSCKED